MIVYSSLLRLLDADPRDAVRSALRTWLGQKVRRVPDEALRQGRHELGQGHQLEVEEFDYKEDPAAHHRRPEHDWALAIRYSHPDRHVKGRRWLTDVGLSLWNGSMSSATVRLQTEEQSALANKPVATTRPRVVALIQEACRLHSQTPGKNVRHLTANDVDAFQSFARDADRRHPIVLLSHDTTGRPAVDPDRLADLLLGIADVAVIPANEDTFALERALGAGLCPYRGALDILWPVASGEFTRRVARTRILAEHLETMRAEGRDPTSELLARVCHETNGKVAAWHVDLASVRALRLRLELDLTKEKLAKSASPEQRELLRMYEQFEKDDKARISQLEQDKEHLNDDLVAERALREEAEQEAKAARHKADALEMAIQQSKRGGADPSAVEPLRAAFQRVLQKEPTLEDALGLLEHLYPERLVILETAWKSARAASKFRDGDRAFDLLYRLCTGYHSAMCAGKGDKEAVQVFGKNSFAARESETVANNKKARSLRTFTYKGQQVLMLRHLKIHVKESDATTFRAHFHWDAEDKVVVLGHCGGHLDHD